MEVETVEGCTIIRGNIDPMVLIRLVPKRYKTVMDTNAARMAEASMVFGKPKDLALLRKKLEPGARERTARQYPFMSPAAIEWLAVGEQGSSSRAIFFAAMNLPHREGDIERVTAHPSDADDFRKCRQLLEAVPEVAARFAAVMPDVSPTWAALVPEWERLCQIMDEESPRWRTGQGAAPRTCNALRTIQDGIQRTPAP